MRIRFRRGTAASAAATNPILADGEPGYTTDTHVLKIGDGETAWNSLEGLEGDEAPGGGSSSTEYMFAFPGGDISGWCSDSGVPLDEWQQSDETYASSQVNPGPSGYSLLVTWPDPSGSDYIRTPKFPVAAGDVLEWVTTFVSADGEPLSLNDQYPLWWLVGNNAAGYDTYGQEPYIALVDQGPVNGAISKRFIGGSAVTIPGHAIVPADVAQSSIEFYVTKPSNNTNAYAYHVLGCFVRVTTPPAIT